MTSTASVTRRAVPPRPGSRRRGEEGSVAVSGEGASAGEVLMTPDVRKRCPAPQHSHPLFRDEYGHPLTHTGVPPHGRGTQDRPPGGGGRQARSRRSLDVSRSVPGALLLPAPADAGVDEAVDVAVEDRVGVADLEAGPQVLDHLVGVEHAGAHLALGASGSSWTAKDPAS